MVKRKVRWRKPAEKQFKSAVLFIAQDSLTNAENFRVEILEKVNELLKHPHKYPPDKNKIHNDGTFRALEIHHYRIIYRIKPSEILVLRMRHTKMKPRQY